MNVYIKVQQGIWGDDLISKVLTTLVKSGVVAQSCNSSFSKIEGKDPWGLLGSQFRWIIISFWKISIEWSRKKTSLGPSPTFVFAPADMCPLTYTHWKRGEKERKRERTSSRKNVYGKEVGKGWKGNRTVFSALLRHSLQEMCQERWEVDYIGEGTVATISMTHA